MSSEDSDSDRDPPEKRPYYDEDSSDENYESGDESAVFATCALVSASAGDTAAQLIRDNDMGVRCQCKTNHWKLLPVDRLETSYMLSLRGDMRKAELKLFVLGELHMYIRLVKD